MMLFILHEDTGLWKCCGIYFINSTMIPVWHNLRRYDNKICKDMTTDGNDGVSYPSEMSRLLLNVS